MFETSVRILSIALEGRSRARIMALHPHLRQDEIWWLLKTLANRKLLEMIPLQPTELRSTESSL